MTSTPRVLKSREKAATLGRKRKEYSVTDSEHVKIKALLKELRASNELRGFIVV